MRGLVASVLVAGVVGFGGISGVQAAAVPGYERLYATMITDCTLPVGTLVACEAAITAYAEAMVTGVDIDTANQSFVEARLEVFAINEPDEEFQFDIDALFELLLPDSGAIGDAEGEGLAATANDGSAGVATSPI